MKKIGALIVLAAIAGAAVVLTGTSKPPLRLTAAAAAPTAHIGYYAGVGYSSGSVGTEGDPVRGATVHLRKAVCHQIVSVRLRTVAAGGKGLMFVRDRDRTDSGTHWLTSAAPTPMPTGLLGQGSWFEISFKTPGTFPLTFASTDCPGVLDAARVTVVATG